MSIGIRSIKLTVTYDKCNVTTYIKIYETAEISTTCNKRKIVKKKV